MIVRAKDGSIDTYPHYRLVKSDKRYEPADTIRNQQRGIIYNALDHDEKRDRYKVLHDEGTLATITAKNIRETEPNRLSEMEVSYCSTQPNLPERIRQRL